VGSYLAITALAVSEDPAATTPDPVVGFAAFTDSPVAPEMPDGVAAEDWVNWVRQSYDLPEVQVRVCMSIPVREQASRRRPGGAPCCVGQPTSPCLWRAACPHARPTTQPHVASR
jgi:hypothetical protein